MKTVFKLFNFSLVLLLLIAMIACNSAGGEQANGQPATNGQEESINRLEKIKNDGRMVVALDATYPPFMFHIELDGQDHITGYEVEVMRLVAEELGVEIAIQDVEFGQILSGVEVGMYDIGIGGLNPSPERLEVLDFTDYYYEGFFTILVQKGQEGNYSKSSDMDGKTVGVQVGTVNEAMLKESMVQENYQVEMVALPSVSDLVIQLQAGMVEAVVIDSAVATNYVNENDNIAMAEAVNFSELDRKIGAAAVVQKGQKELLDYLNDFIARKTEDGTLEKLYEESVELAKKN